MLQGMASNIDFRLARGIASVAFAALALFADNAAAQKKAEPKPRSPEKLVEALFEADGWSPEGRRERADILLELEALPALEAKDIAKWKSSCAKLWAKGTKLEKKNGRHFLWEKPEERGMFIVGGESRKPRGLLIAMHGGGAGAGDAWSAHGPYQSPASKLDWLMICPEVLEKTEHGWTDSGSEEFVLQLVDAARRTWKIDANRVYFSGHSMGGYGTWTLGAHHADRVAALAASAGAPSPVTGPSGKYEDIVAGVIPSLRNVPLVVYQSDDDPNVPPEANRIAAQLMGKAKERWGGFDFEYWEVPSRAHDLPPGGMEALLAKIAERVRDPRPKKIVWQPALSWKQQFYWLWWRAPQTGAILEAQVDAEKNAIHLVCDRTPKDLEVLLDERLLDLKKPVMITLNGAQVYSDTPQPSLAVLAKTALVGDDDLVFSMSVRITPP
jgi:pimeloyl-ACP methyl ester carboxylesterase